MLEPPGLPEDRIVAAVRRHYGLHLTTLDFLPLGHDVKAWSFRAATVDASYFLKLRRGVVNHAALRVPRYLVDHRAQHVVAPLPARDRRLWLDLDGFTLALYPLIDGATGMARGFQEHHWVMYGAALKELHDTPLAPELVRGLTRESFSLAQLFQRLRQARWTAVVQALEAHSTLGLLTDASERDLAAFWRVKRAEIEALVDRFETLGRQLHATSPRLVLCHADVHPNNVLIDTDDQLWLVDWDEILLAPKECDLMMGVGGLGNYPAGPRQAAWFLRGYGSTDIDPIALAFYRHARALGDIGANVEQVLLPTAGAAAKREALQWLLQLFAPGYIVTLARQAANSVS